MRILSLAVCLMASGLLQAAPAYTGPVKAQEVRTREGVGNFLGKLKAGKTVTVAYLGGSITAMNGWRNMTTAWLQKANTNAVVKEVHAAIGGTGSDLGVFRVGHDALRHKPDLLFVEFATNDGGRKPEEIWRSMEGIVRRTWKQDSQTDIIFTYTITTAMTNDYIKGICNRSASAMEQLADHYGIPSICFGPRVIEYLSANKLVMSAKEYENAVSKDDLDREKTALCSVFILYILLCFRLALNNFFFISAFLFVLYILLYLFFFKYCGLLRRRKKFPLPFEVLLAV